MRWISLSPDHVDIHRVEFDAMDIPQSRPRRYPSRQIQQLISFRYFSIEGQDDNQLPVCFFVAILRTDWERKQPKYKFLFKLLRRAREDNFSLIKVRLD